MKMLELTDHPFFMTTQAHLEFRSRPFASRPLFRAFAGAEINMLNLK
jgi:CTP synthase